MRRNAGRAMSQKNVDIIERAYVDLTSRCRRLARRVSRERRDVRPRRRPEGPARQGHEALREWVETMDEIWRAAPRTRGVRRRRWLCSCRATRPRSSARHRRPIRRAPVSCVRCARRQNPARTAYLDKAEALEAVGWPTRRCRRRTWRSSRPLGVVRSSLSLARGGGTGDFRAEVLEYIDARRWVIAPRSMRDGFADHDVEVATRGRVPMASSGTPHGACGRTEQCRRRHGRCSVRISKTMDNRHPSVVVEELAGRRG